MHPSHHQELRQATTMALHKQYHSNPEVCYVDTACFPGRSAVTAVVVDNQGNVEPSCSVSTSRPDTVEDVAIALAITGTLASIVISDSKTNLRNYAKGRVSKGRKPRLYYGAALRQEKDKSVSFGHQCTHTSQGTKWPTRQPEGCATRLTLSPKRFRLTRGEGIVNGHIRKLRSTVV
ncbi:hypothetical protein HPB48_000529 [Haemaphysalis longicornis]|uniref:Uncharacterized protein n=1 Tax=Haemaphysalis longicornis TaxID=44386 RepID=A0A9J6GQ49_HAELO|nr:hypothetical protein HPB48_000529 [Haemaphysalis longicornis]